MSVAIVLLLLLLAHLHKKSTQNERSKLHETRKKTQKISDQTTMMTGKDCSAFASINRAIWNRELELE